MGNCRRGLSVVVIPYSVLNSDFSLSVRFEAISLMNCSVSSNLIYRLGSLMSAYITECSAQYRTTSVFRILLTKIKTHHCN